MLFGNDDNDILNGGAGGDSLDGGAGDDILNGGAGIDILFGGSGSDEFRFDAPSEGGDLVRDFISGEDIITLASAGFNFGYTGMLNAADFSSGAGLPADLSGNNPQLYLDFDSQGLWFDPTGGDTSDIQIVAGFETGIPDYNDIFLV